MGRGEEREVGVPVAAATSGVGLVSGVRLPNHPRVAVDVLVGTGSGTNADACLVVQLRSKSQTMFISEGVMPPHATGALHQIDWLQSIFNMLLPWKWGNARDNNTPDSLSASPRTVSMDTRELVESSHLSLRWPYILDSAATAARESIIPVFA